jgi:hypothetical protein
MIWRKSAGMSAVLVCPKLCRVQFERKSQLVVLELPIPKQDLMKVWEKHKRRYKYSLADF